MLLPILPRGRSMPLSPKLPLSMGLLMPLPRCPSMRPPASKRPRSPSPPPSNRPPGGTSKRPAGDASKRPAGGASKRPAGGASKRPPGDAMPAPSSPESKSRNRLWADLLGTDRGSEDRRSRLMEAHISSASKVSQHTGSCAALETTTLPSNSFTESGIGSSPRPLNDSIFSLVYRITTLVGPLSTGKSSFEARSPPRLSCPNPSPEPERVRAMPVEALRGVDR
mmetsp:Transcript_12956/g.28146  ORF Transcript_12956/g.28146 Transcript_12956/m.28146 type:complete len:224 (-) Transcript_12956:423-1094(-)